MCLRFCIQYLPFLGMVLCRDLRAATARPRHLRDSPRLDADNLSFFCLHVTLSCAYVFTRRPDQLGADGKTLAVSPR